MKALATMPPALRSGSVIAVFIIALILLVAVQARAQSQIFPDQRIGASMAGMPQGQWRQFCFNPRLNGTRLTAMCRRDGSSYAPSEGDIGQCNNVVAYWETDGKFYCGEGNSFKLPPGPWRTSCSWADIQGARFEATCLGTDGKLHDIVADLSACPRHEVLYFNYRMVCGRAIGTYVETIPARTRWLPPGEWRKTCRFPGMKRSILEARCYRDINDGTGYAPRSEIDVNNCRDGIRNDRGTLKCQSGAPKDAPIIRR